METVSRPTAAMQGFWLDEFGIVHSQDGWVALPDIEWRLVELLMHRFGFLVPRDELLAAGWPERTVPETSLNVRIRMARQRLQPLGLEIKTVRSRGYVLERSK